MTIDETTRDGRVEETVCRVAIQALLGAYADDINRRSFGGLSALFLPDARIELTTLKQQPLVLTGPEALGRFIAEFVERLDFFQFVLLNSRLELRLDADAALGRHFICEYRWEKAGKPFTRVFGVYRDRYRRIDGRWWFAERVFDPLLSAGSDDHVVGFPTRFEPFLSSDG
ncbi:MAG: nuclear transport factor 2 family protein [Deltaproteobacteria bacterium]|nr:nuclear transport factor 2 family protein [Deltaproteobacteria bacterium]